MATFDPNAASAADSGVFGLPFTEKEAKLVLIPVPWEATTSYGGGTSEGPKAILEASRQVDLYDLDVVRPYEAGIAMAKELVKIRAMSRRAKSEAARIIEAGGVITKKLEPALKLVNKISDELNEMVYAETKRVLAAGKLAAIVGGDHSTPFGALRAIAEKNPSFGILHFDAHSDTRKAFEGFTWSHASIMYNVLEKIPQVKKLVQIGIRDICEEEIQYTKKLGKRVEVFFDRDLQRSKFEGSSWAAIARNVVAALPQQVWISFDIDGLDPLFCPHTGTPVPGGLSFAEATYLLGLVVQSGRKIIGFDLNEVAPAEGGSDEWDANVGARMLYKLSAWTLASQGLAELQR